jgi:hypothetical protein
MLYFLDLAALILYITPSLQQSIAQQSTQFIIYTNPNLGIKLQHPSDWLQERENSTHHINVRGEAVSDSIIHHIRFKPPGSIYNAFTISVLSAPNVPLDKRVSDDIGLLKITSKIHFTHSDYNSDLAGNRAYHIEYSFIRDAFPYVSASYYTKIGGTIYVLTFDFQTANYSAVYFPIVQKIINSFEVQESNIYSNRAPDQTPQHNIGKSYSSVMAINPVTHKLYLSNYGFVSVIDELTDREETRILTSNFSALHSFLNPRNDNLYLAGRQDVVVIHLKSNKAENILHFNGTESYIQGISADPFFRGNRITTRN